MSTLENCNREYNFRALDIACLDCAAKCSAWLKKRSHLKETLKSKSIQREPISIPH